MLDQLTGLVAASRSLDAEQTRMAVAQLIDENIPATTKAEFLTALACKGETTEEITEFARALRDKSIAPHSTPGPAPAKSSTCAARAATGWARSTFPRPWP